ncbi:MAG: TMEM143 family protein [Methyloligellaceae bacterium]
MMNNSITTDISDQVNQIEDELEEVREPAAVSTTKPERFIPVTRFALMDRIRNPEAWPAEIYEDVMATLDNLANWRHQVYARRLAAVMESYIPFSPDRDTINVTELSEAQLMDKRQDLMERMTVILERANYEEISDDELDAYFTAQGPYGLNLKVDMSEYDESLVYYRGSDEQKQEKRDWRRLYLTKYTEVIPIFQRLFLVLKLKPEHLRIKEIMEKDGVDEKKAEKRLKKYRKNLPEGISSDHVYLKTFKNIPQSDLEMLFPNTKVEFKLFDKIKFWVSAGGGTISGLVGAVIKILGSAVSPITLLIAIGGFGGVMVRQVTSFFNQRNRYMMVLAQNLYFHSLANNRGALTLLLDRAEEEDIKEEILLYSYLVHNTVALHERVEAQGEIEEYLNGEFGITIEFDFEDALERLVEDGLVETDAQGTIKAVPPARCREILTDKWNGVLVAKEQPTQNSNAA